MTEIERVIECINKTNYLGKDELFWEMAHMKIVFNNSNHKNLVDFYFDDNLNPSAFRLMQVVPTRIYEKLFIKFTKELDLPENLINEINRIVILGNLEK